MRRRRCRHTIALLTPVVWTAAVLAVFCSTAAAAPTTRPKPKQAVATGVLPGTWVGTYSGAFSGTFTLRWKQKGSRLYGSIKLSRPSGTYGINGKVRGKTIGFGAVGVGATYTGRLSGKSMSGRYKSPQGGGSWSARKAS